jgi:hypothetical protein
MIRESKNDSNRAVVSSDRWHVVHARWERNLTEPARFARTIVSEHDDRAAASVSARALMHDLVADLAERPLHLRDQIFLRKPGYLSLQRAQRLTRKPV